MSLVEFQKPLGVDNWLTNILSRNHGPQIVIGSGPAAQKCAIDSVKRGKRVALIDKNSQMGGVCVVRRTESSSWRLVSMLLWEEGKAPLPCVGMPHACLPCNDTWRVTFDTIMRWLIPAHGHHSE
jgi:hypothetical protein